MTNIETIQHDDGRVLGSFEGHAGYDGVFLGLPGADYHLEFTRHAAGSPCPAPTRDNLLVLYVEDRAAVLRKVGRLRAMGCEPVEPENPYWAEKGFTFEDRRLAVVMMNRRGLGVKRRTRKGTPETMKRQLVQFIVKSFFRLFLLALRLSAARGGG